MTKLKDDSKVYNHRVLKSPVHVTPTQYMQIVIVYSILLNAGDGVGPSLRICLKAEGIYHRT